MGGINSCCIPRNSGIEDGESTTRAKGFKSHKRQLSATFNMSLGEESEALVNGQIDVNSATEEELMTLSGVNRETAKAIIEYRKQIRGFKCVEDVALVSGVGAAKLEKFRDEVCVKRINGVVSSGRDKQNGRDSPRDKSTGLLINVNTSNVFQLMQVKGIGQTLAENIVSYRDKKGPFFCLDDLIKVKGIGYHILSSIRPHLTLDENFASDDLSYTSSKKSSNFNNSAIPSRTSEISMNSENHSNPSVEFSKTSLENLVDALGPMSEKPARPFVDLPVFKYKNRNALKIASWNLECFSTEKSNNVGVRDVVCMTILENG